MIKYNIISTGSKGNAVVLNNEVLIDCGVPFKLIEPYYKSLKLVLLTHIHSDHFHKATITRLAAQRPMLRFACGEWLVKPLVEECKVAKTKLDIVRFCTKLSYRFCEISNFELFHDVPNCGWKIFFPNGKVIYATDTVSMGDVSAPDYDLYLIEANYEDEEIEQRIHDKVKNGDYAYEFRAKKNHLSRAKCDDFIYRNIGTKGEYVYMHTHSDE